METNNDLKKIVFLDRDGVINKKAPEHEYITNLDDFVLNKNLFSMIDPFKKDGYEFIIITNQRGIARGLLTEQYLQIIHEHMKVLLKEIGIEILDIFYCPHGDDSCNCRKPKPGMLENAFAKYNIDLASTVLIGDSKSDIEAGIAFGINKNILVKSDSLDILKIVTN